MFLIRHRQHPTMEQIRLTGKTRSEWPLTVDFIGFLLLGFCFSAASWLKAPTNYELTQS